MLHSACTCARHQWTDICFFHQLDNEAAPYDSAVTCCVLCRRGCTMMSCGNIALHLKKNPKQTNMQNTGRGETFLTRPLLTSFAKKISVQLVCMLTVISLNLQFAFVNVCVSGITLLNEWVFRFLRCNRRIMEQKNLFMLSQNLLQRCLYSITNTQIETTTPLASADGLLYYSLSCGAQ